MGIAVLGPLTVDDSGTLGRRDRIILEALVARSGRPVSPDQLADAVWGDRPPASAAKNVQGCIVRLRKLLGQDAIATTTHGYQLTVPADTVDARRFERSVDRSRELLLLGEHDRAAFQLTEALALWRGEPFSALEGWVGAEAEVRRLQELRLDAEELRIEAHIGAGSHREVLAEAQALVGAAPMRERRWALLAHAQYLTGRQGDALRTIHQLRSVLSEHLGIDPGPDVVALESAILRQDDSLLGAPPRAEARATCPYQGLLAYDLHDVERFFGREGDVTACLRVLGRSRLLALVGPSGSGKSSLLRAGVGAALRDSGRGSRVITPGPHPMKSLAALAGASDTTALLVDQFEEVFTLCPDPEERDAFISELVAELATRTVVLALRSDRLADLAAHPDLGRHVEEGLHLVAGLGEEGLRQAVEAPARQAGLHLEPGLVDLLVREVEGDPGALPLFSHALLETWRRREGNTLTVDGYRASGGIHGAVAQSAERLYAQTDDEHRPMLRNLILRLVSPGEQGEPVRTRVPRRLVAADPDHDRMVDELVAARLVTTDDGSLEITHEALARAWPRLRAWLDDDVEGQRLLHHLSGAADAWDSMGRPDSELYRGVRLVRALDWQAGTTSALTDTERDFLDRARVVAEIEEQTAAERARTQARLIRRLRVVLGGAVALLALALVAGGFAAVQSDRASENAVRAEQAAVSADAQRVGLRSQLTDDISLSLLLAAAGARLDDSPQTRVNLLTALNARPRLVRSGPPGPYKEGFDLSSDGRWIASSDDQNTMHLYDAGTGRLLRHYGAGPLPAEDLSGFLPGAFSPDDRQLAVVVQAVASTQPVRVLDPSTMQPTLELAPVDEPVWGVGVAFSGDGRYLAATVQTVDWYVTDTSAAPGFAMVWDLRAPSRPPIRLPIGPNDQGLVLSPDGRALYTTWPLAAYDLTDGSQLWRRKDIVSAGYGVLDINRTGTLLAMARSGSRGCGGPLLVRAATGATARTLPGARACDIRFSPDGTLVGSLYEGVLSVSEAATGRLLTRIRTFDPWGIGFSPGNDLVHTGGADSVLRTWDLSGDHSYLRRTTDVGAAPVYADADLSPDGQRVAYRWNDTSGAGWITFVDVATGETTTPARLPTRLSPISSGTWHPDGRQYVGWCSEEDGPCDEPGVVTILDTTTGQVVGRRHLFDTDIHAVSYVDGGERLLVGSRDHRVRLLDSDSLVPTEQTVHHAADTSTPIADGSTAVVYQDTGAGFTERFRVIEVRSGDVLAEGTVDFAVYASAVAPDGSVVAMAGDTGEIAVVDIATGAEQRRSTGLGTGVGVRWLDYSDDGTLLVSAADGGAVSLWDVDTLELMGTVRPPDDDGPITAGAQFIGDTHDVAIASYDGVVYRWDTDLERALDFACRMAGRDVTEAEWRQFLPAQPYRSVCPDA